MNTENKAPSTAGKGPRVTLEDINAAIESEDYFSAAQGVEGREYLGTYGHLGPLDMMTICVLTLHNKFTIIGKAACVSAANFDADLGRKYARENAVEQMWPLMGFALADRIYREDDSFKAGFDSVNASTESGLPG